MRTWLGLLLLLLLSASAAAGVPTRPELALGRSEDHDYDPPEPGTYRLPVIKPAADGKVLDAAGRELRLREVLAGRINLVSFIYTSCADPRACPHASGVLYKIHGVTRQDPQLAQQLRLVTFSFDPAHDTPRVMADYGRGLVGEGGGCEWTFLTTASARQLAPILDAYGQRVDRKRDPDDPLGPLAHTVRVFLVDRAGLVRNIYDFGSLDPRLVVTDVRTLLLEEQAHAGAN